MKKSKNNSKLINLIIVFAVFSFGIIIYRLIILGTSTYVDGVNLKEFASSRSTASVTIKAARGEIYDKFGNALAQNVSSYTLIAYVDPIRSEGESKIYHVQDKEATAKALATVINMKYEDILDILNTKDVYQVEFGNAGRSLTEIQKDAIVALNLPGIDFVSDTKRYYPNGDFASYVLGYAKEDSDGNTTGEMGLETLLNDVLAGTDGHKEYQKDLNGYKIAGTAEVGEDAINGNNVYLTIDSNIQLILEQSLAKAEEVTSYDWMSVVICDAKTGAILAISQSPSFDPNTLDIKNWVDYSSQQAFEPGSIMKIYTYMAAMEKGSYKGDQTFTSGVYVTDDGTKIYDWRRSGFGQITYDQGFMASSNTGVINIMNNFIDKNDLDAYFKKMGFGSKTGITLANEDSGEISFNYQTEVYNASFGQGITTTPIQHIQALTSIANDGVMLRPYIIDKVVDQNGDVVYTGKREEVATVATHETAEKIKNLMYDTVHSDWPYVTADIYNIEGYDLIGKTGTAQLVDEKTGAYYTNDYYTTKSFVGMWPKNDPEVIIYASVRKPEYGTSKALTTVVTSVVKNVSSYLNIFTNADKTTDNINIDNYINTNTTNTIKLFQDKGITPIVLGNGNKIIKQYPESGAVINTNDKVIFLTNDISYTMPNFSGYSKKDVTSICEMLSLKCIYQNFGYAYAQSIPANSPVTSNMEVTIAFKEIY